MFKLDQMLGAQEEDFGPPKPTTIEKVTQLAMDTTGLQKNILIALGAGVVAYFAYQYFYGE